MRPVWPVRACLEENRTYELDKMPEEQVAHAIHAAEEAARKAAEAIEEVQEGGCVAG